MPETSDMSTTRQAARFQQMASIERALVLKLGEIAECKAHLSELNKESEGLILRMRQAARDEGDLPLFFGIES